MGEIDLVQVFLKRFVSHFRLGIGDDFLTFLVPSNTLAAMPISMSSAPVGVKLRKVSLSETFFQPLADIVHATHRPPDLRHAALGDIGFGQCRFPFFLVGRQGGWAARIPPAREFAGRRRLFPTSWIISCNTPSWSNRGDFGSGATSLAISRIPWFLHACGTSSVSSINCV